MIFHCSPLGEHVTVYRVKSFGTTYSMEPKYPSTRAWLFVPCVVRLIKWQTVTSSEEHWDYGMSSVKALILKRNLHVMLATL